LYKTARRTKGSLGDSAEQLLIMAIFAAFEEMVSPFLRRFEFQNPDCVVLIPSVDDSIRVKRDFQSERFCDSGIATAAR
jgi:hypothetical protein